MAASSLDTPRIRFNWGFHDGAHDVERGKPARTMGEHLFALPPGDDALSRAYRTGYQSGRNAAQAPHLVGEPAPTSSSEPAWQAALDAGEVSES